jgi:hypothetical protein
MDDLPKGHIEIPLVHRGNPKPESKKLLSPPFSASAKKLVVIFSSFLLASAQLLSYSL